MNLDDFKDNIKSQLSSIWSRLEESSFYNQMKDRFENLTPQKQKLAMMGSGAVLALLVISIPYSYYSESNNYITHFEDQRNLIRELLKVTRESSEVPDIPMAPQAEILKTTIENQLHSANLLPEQMKSIEISMAQTGLIPQSLLSGAVKVVLSKLNLRQIVDIGYNIQNISPSVKMSDLNINANSEDPKYFDVEMKLVSLAVPQASHDMGGDMEESVRDGGSGNGGGNSGNGGGGSANKGKPARKPFKRGDR